MKKIIPALILALTLIFTACEGDQGPPGQDGINILGNVFETTVDFTANNGYSNLITIPNSIEVFESDVILVYRLETVVPDNQGGTIDVWTQLPQPLFPFSPNPGTLAYNFDFTFIDVNLFLEADFELNLLSNNLTNDQTFRIAIVPAEFADTNLSMEALIQTLQVNPNNIINVQ